MTVCINSADVTRKHSCRDFFTVHDRHVSRKSYVYVLEDRSFRWRTAASDTCSHLYPLLLSRYSSTTSSTWILKAYYNGTPERRIFLLANDYLPSMDNYTENFTKLTAKLHGFVRFDGQSFLTFGKFAIKNVNRIYFSPSPRSRT